MRTIRYQFLLIVGLIMTLGVVTAFADGKESKKKAPKNMGTLSVKTSETSYPVKVDGQYVGMSGVNTGAEFYLEPGYHTVEIEGPDGKVKRLENVEIIKGRKNCICLKTVTTPKETPCPYDIRLEGPDSVMEGDLVTFSAFNQVTGAPVPLNYKWSVSNGNITSGQGTSAITVDTTGMRNKTVNAELDVNDDVYSAQCRQVINVPTGVTPPPEPIQRIQCDEFVSKAADDDKARLDNCVIQVQNSPDAQLYVIIYQGTDKISTTRNTYDKLSKRAMDYLVNVRGLDPRRIQIVRGPDRAKTTYVMWIVPPGAEPPTP